MLREFLTLTIHGNRSRWRRLTGLQHVALILSGVAAAVLIHALTVDHTTYDDRFVLYFRSRQLWWQRRYQRNKYFLGTSHALLHGRYLKVIAVALQRH
jgi:hypothetical protein